MTNNKNIVKCNCCNEIQIYSTCLNLCPECKNEFITLTKDNIFDFIYTIIERYILEGEILVNSANKISIFQDGELEKECDCLELINDYISFLTDLAKDNLHTYSIDGDNYLAIRNISVDLYNLNQIKTQLYM